MGRVLMGRVLIAVLMVAMICLLVPAFAADMDGDGISDEHERMLGTDPKLPETLTVVSEPGAVPENRRGAGYDPTKDVVKVEFGHVAGDRYLWRTTFAAPPRLEDTVHHYYVDADSNAQTGREGRGVEYMLSVVSGGAKSTFYNPDGSTGASPSVNFVIEGNTLLVTSDVQLGRNEQGATFSMYVLCHTATQTPPMSKSVAPFVVQNIPLNDREKIMRIQDMTTSVNVTGTYGLDIIRPMLTNPQNIIVNYDELKTNGFSTDLFTQNRYGHLKMDRRGGTVSTTAPKAGKYTVGFMIYDDSNPERVAMYVNGEFAGLAVIEGNNNRTWIYHLSEPRDLKAGDEITLEGLGTGKHGICNILFMAQAPKVRQVEYRVENTRWLAPVGTKGEVSISWTTTWPSASRFEYGTTTKYGETAEEQCNRLVHRVYLKGLKPGVTYHGRAVAMQPDGKTTYAGPDISFTADAPERPATRTGVTRVPLTVRNWHNVDAKAWPVTNGVPFPAGVLGNENDLRVMRDGKEVLAQVKPLGTWPDGSLKWVLVTVLADVPAGRSAEYVLEFGRNVKRQLNGPALAVAGAEGVALDTGAAKFKVDKNGDLWGPNGRIETRLTSDGGKVFSSSRGPASVTIEEAGPVRAVVKTVGNLKAEDGSESFRVEQRITAWRGQPFVQIQHTFINDREERFTDIESLSLVVSGARNGWTATLAKGEPVKLAAGQAAWQRFDNEYLVGADKADGRLTGGIAAADGSLAVTVRDCWQNYPKGFAATAEGLRVDLAPDFEAGVYDAFPFEGAGHHLYYYLRDGHYRFRQGMSKTHELLLDFGSDAAARSAIFQQPLLLTATPQWYTGSMAFYNVAPRNEKLFKAYEESVDKNIEAYKAGMERQRDYGLMNYGDWYGERGANWGNIEYDTQHAFFLEYIRSGNPDAFFLGDTAEKHNRDVDTVQWAPNPLSVGLAMVHQMGHVGGYYTEGVPGTLGIPNAGGSVTHSWTEGHFDHYYLTGDPRSLETGMAIVNYFTDKELSRCYDWVSAREPGWHLIMLASALAATNDPYYLNASRIVVDRVLEAQDPEPRPMPKYQQEPGHTHQNGGWTRMMVPGHCTCEPRHQGNANFMIAILLTGLTYYHDVTNEPAVKESIIRGSRYLIEEMYSTRTHGFRYTPCPNMRYTAGVTPLMAEAIARAYRWTKDPIFEDALTNGLALGAGGAAYGKSFSMYYRCAPRLLADLAEMGLTIDEARRLELTAFTKPDWMKALPENRMIVIQAEDMEQGGGMAEVVSDRQAVWGTAVTKWHNDLGHWLQWKFKVPEAGNYRMVFRYGTLTQNTRRKLEVDGAVPNPAAAEIVFPATGGFGASPDDWKYLPLKDAAGQDVVLPLKAGEHVLKMTNLGDGIAMDFITLVRVD